MAVARPWESELEEGRAEAPEAVDEFERVLLRRQLGTALTGVSAAHREVFELVHVRGYSIRETAQRLGVPAGTVKSRTHHALRALRQALASDQPEPVAAAA
jgi:RNA polymerase sigma-70 factor (ECF subfamily)